MPGHAGVQGGRRGPPAEERGHRYDGKHRYFAQTRPLPSAAPSNVALPSDLKPRGAAAGFIPGLPAYIIFMCVRYADCVNDDQRVSALLNSAISSIKSVIKVR